MLCLPAHTTHILQPLDVGVFKSFYYKACKKRIAEHPNRVITTDQIASLVGTAWPQALTAVNIMSGFKKCGIYPLNAGEVTDRQLAPSTLFNSSSSSTYQMPPSHTLHQMPHGQTPHQTPRLSPRHLLWGDQILVIVIQNIGRNTRRGVTSTLMITYSGSVTTSYHFLREIPRHTNHQYLRRPLPIVMKSLPAF